MMGNDLEQWMAGWLGLEWFVHGLRIFLPWLKLDDRSWFVAGLWKGVG